MPVKLRRWLVRGSCLAAAGLIAGTRILPRPCRLPDTRFLDRCKFVVAALPQPRRMPTLYQFMPPFFLAARLRRARVSR